MRRNLCIPRFTDAFKNASVNPKCCKNKLIQRDFSAFNVTSKFQYLQPCHGGKPAVTGKNRMSEIKISNVRKNKFNHHRRVVRHLIAHFATIVKWSLIGG